MRGIDHSMPNTSKKILILKYESMTLCCYLQNMVPVVIYGFEGLKTRMESQKGVLKSIEKSIEMLQKASTQIRVVVADCDRMARQCNMRQCELEEKLIRVLGKLEAKSNKSQVVITNESFMETLVKLQKAVTLPTYPFNLCILVSFIESQQG